MGLSAQLVTFPLTLYYFHQFPTYFYITNLVTAFLAAALVPLGLGLWACAGFETLASGIGILTGWCAWGLNRLNGEIAHLPFSVVTGFYMTRIEVFLWYGVFMFWLWGSRWIAKKMDCLDDLSFFVWIDVLAFESRYTTGKEKHLGILGNKTSAIGDEDTR